MVLCKSWKFLYGSKIHDGHLGRTLDLVFKNVLIILGHYRKINNTFLGHYRKINNTFLRNYKHDCTQTDHELHIMVLR